MKTVLKKILFWIIIIQIVPTFLSAHAAEQSYLYLRVFEESIEGTVEITSDDINSALGLNLKRGLTKETIQPYLSQLYNYLTKHVSIKSKFGAHALNFTDVDFLEIKNVGEFIRFNFDLDNTATIPDEMDVKYDVLLDKEPIHRNLLVIGHNWKAGIVDNEAMTSLIFSPGDREQTLQLAKGSLWQGFMAMVKLGMWHIWIGLDHILFLLALILPAVVRRQKPALAGVSNSGNSTASTTKWPLQKWKPVDRFKPAFIYIVKIVTFFTIAHSLTLSLAALELIILPSRFVESVIALSIALAAYHNIQPIFKNNEWIIAFGFGIFHGFGFASVLSGKGLSGEFMTLSLLGFNVGVEIGQIAIICIIFPVLFFLRKSISYPKILAYGSIVLILISLFWATERIFDVNLLLDDYLMKIYRKGMRFIGLRS